MLVDYTKSITNVVMWIEHPEMITRLNSIERGECAQGSAVRQEGGRDVPFAVWTVTPAPVLDIKGLIHNHFGIVNTEGFLKFIYRYIRPDSSSLGLSDDDYFMPFDEIVRISSLDRSKYNIDALVEAIIDLQVAYQLDEHEDWMAVIIDDLIPEFEVKGEDFTPWITQAMEKHPDKLEKYRAGQVGLFNLFFGEVMKTLPNKNIDKQALSNDLKTLLEKNL